MKKTLLMGTAMVMLMSAGTAYAGNIADVLQIGTDNTGSIDQNGGDGNVSRVKQDGNDNTASIQQDGDKNIAGRNNNTNPIYGKMWQTGNDNSIDVLQTGNNNGIVARTGTGNFYQNGDRNEASITQHGSGGAYGPGNEVDNIVQTANSGGSNPTNRLTILQDKVPNNFYGVPGVDSVYGQAIGGGNYSYIWNFIGSVTQTNTGGATNELTLTQKGAIFNRENKIAHAEQTGTGNTGSIDQNGIVNYTGTFSQTGTGNSAELDLHGFGNGGDSNYTAVNTLGAGSFSANSPANPSLAGAAWGVAISQGDMIQNGTGNTFSLSVNGDSTRYGFSQLGDYNSIDGTTSANGNEVAVMQNGAHNVTDFTQTGDSNDLGVAIYGDHNGDALSFRGASDIGLSNGEITQRDGTNYASIAIGDGGTNADKNNFAAKQTGGNNTLQLAMVGDQNNFAINQAGGDTASATVNGSQNVMGVRQLGGGVGNSLEVTITGNLNNWSGSFHGDASGVSLAPGSVYQNNSGGLINDINLTVSSSSNLFAFRQVGSNNTIEGTVSGGDGNQAAVTQTGVSNQASFNQNGAGNVAIISQ